MDYGSVVFDMDGVILDSMKDHSWTYDAVEKVARKEGVERELGENEKAALLGEQGTERCVRLCQELGLDSRQVWTEICGATTKARIREIKSNGMGLVDGVEEVVNQFHSQDVRLALISNAPDEAVEFVVKYFGLESRFDFYLGLRDFEDLALKKPAPDHLEVAKAELGRNPYLYVGDAESDVIAAHRANMDSAWLHPSKESDVRADYELKTLNSLLEIVR